MAAPAAFSVPPLAIVGLGAVGTALAHAARAAGVPVAAVASRSPLKAEALAAVTGARVLPIADIARAAPLVALSVADDAIEDAAAALGDVSGATVFHCSGARPASVLAPLAARGARTASWHPLAAIAARHGDEAPAQSAAMFRGAIVAVEGASDVPELEALATALGARPVHITAAQKPAYHLGAAILAGFSVALAAVADAEWRRAGIPADVAHDGLAHLLGTVAANLGAAPSPAAALTGPIVRGDVDAVARQVATARTLPPAAAALYRAHTAHLVALAHHGGRIADDTAQRLTQLLLDPPAAP